MKGHAKSGWAKLTDGDLTNDLKKGAGKKEPPAAKIQESCGILKGDAKNQAEKQAKNQAKKQAKKQAKEQIDAWVANVKIRPGGKP